MEGVNLTQKTINIHTIFVVSVCLVFGGMNAVSEGGLVIGVCIAVLGLLVGGCMLLFKNSLSADKGHYSVDRAAAPYYRCLGAQA